MQRPKLFVIMPFLEELEDLWELGIRKTAEHLGWECLRADRITSPGFIVSQIYEQIQEADMVLGDMTGTNPNVFFEIGYATALGKPTLLVARSEKELTAFDTQGFRHQFHRNRISRMEKILRQVLPQIRAGLYEPKIRDAQLLYQWPSKDFDDPNLKRKARSSARAKQVDLLGGQSIDNRLIRISDTEKFWNWQEGLSIMQLGPTSRKDLYKGDTIHLILEARAPHDTRFIFLGDGHYLDPDKKENWAKSWQRVRFSPSESERWSKEYISTKVEPTHPDYDPAVRGTTLYLVTGTGKRPVEIRSIKVFRTPEN